MTTDHAILNGENTAISIRADDLQRALAAVLPHVAKDETTPISSVMLEVDAGVLTIVGTQCYTLAVLKTNLDSYDLAPTWTFLLPRASAENIVKACAGSARKYPVILTPVGTTDAPKLSVTILQAGLTFQVDGREGSYPEWRQLLSSQKQSDTSVPLAGAELGFNPQHLALFVKSAAALSTPRNTTPLRLTFVTPNEPVLVKIGPDFTGLISPVRLK